MPQVNDEIIKQLYMLFQESHTKSSTQKQENLTKADIAKIAKFKRALLEIPFEILASVSGRQAHELRGQYLHYLAQMDFDDRQKVIEKLIHHLSEQFKNLKKMDVNDPNFMRLWDVFNEKLLRIPFSYFKSRELNAEEKALQNYFVLLVNSQIKKGTLDEIKQSQSKHDLKLLLAHTKDIKAHETITKLISADQRIEPLAQRAANTDKHRVSTSPDTSVNKKIK